MREIKYRAWDKLNHCWINLYQIAFSSGGKPMAVNSLTETYGLHQVDIVQYTGLKDKNGKEIYEGDILCIEDTWKEVILDDGSGPVEPCNHLAPVIFQDGSFGVGILESGDAFYKGFWSFSHIELETDETPLGLEVIGNIYENPELLEG